MSVSPYIYPLLKHKLLPKTMMTHRRAFTRFAKEDLVNAIIAEFNAPTDILTKRCRTRQYSEPRKVYCKIGVFEMGHTRVDIAKDIMGYDHATVIHAYTTFDSLYKTDELFREKVDGVYSRLGITK